MKKEKNLKGNSPKSSKIWIVISIVLVAILVIIISYGGYKYYQSQKPIKKDWGETYYLYLKDLKNNEKNNNIPKEAKETKLKFIEVKDIKKPVMVINYQVQEEIHSNIYFIDNEEVNTIIYNEPTKIELLYNVTKEEYNYYFHIETEAEDSYNLVTNEIKNIEDTNKSIEYAFPKDSEEFVTTFIEIEEDDSKYVDFNSDFSNNELKETIENSIDNYETKEEIITDNIQKEVDNKVVEIKQKQEELREALLDKTFEDLYGVWIVDENWTSMQFEYRNGKKYFILGWFASEAAAMGNMENIRIENDVYKFNVGEYDFEFSLESIRNKKLVMGNNTFRYVAKDMNKAYDILL